MIDFSQWKQSDETLDDLQCNQLMILQKKEGFKFGIDAILLANSLQVKSGWRGMDIGTGTGIIPILVASKSRVERIDGVEIQETMANMAKRSVEMNQLSDKIHIYHMDMNDLPRHIGTNKLDFVVSNPPYLHEKGLGNQNRMKHISRHEGTCTVDALMKTTAQILRDLGQLFLIHKTNRLAEIIYIAHRYGLELKSMQMIHSHKEKAPHLWMGRFVKGAKAEVRLYPSLYIYQQPGIYSKQVIRLYNQSQLNAPIV